MTRSEAITALYALFNAPHNADINLAGLNVLLDELYKSHPQEEPHMKSEQIKHSLSVGIKSIQSRVFDRETDEVISFVKIPIKDSGLVRCEKGTREMNNEPVAWMIKTLDGRSLMLYGEEQPPKFKEDVQYIPLYTHPAKDLEDIDINITWNENSMRDFGKDELNFARSILKKAQEK